MLTGPWDLPKNKRPKCDDSKIFLADAVEKIGSALAPDWDGSEIYAPALIRHPDEIWSELRQFRQLGIDAERRRREHAERSHAAGLLGKPAHNDFRATVKPSSRSALPTNEWELDPEQHPTEFAEARGRWIETFEAETAGIARLDAAVSWLLAELINGHLTAYGLNRAGTGPSPIETAYWWGEDKTGAIYACGWGALRLFLDRAKLDVRLAASGVTAPPTVEVAKLSPVLQFAVRFALSREITGPAKNYKEEAMRADIQNEWLAEFGARPSSTQENAVYTTVRFPNDKAIAYGRGERESK
jgi:hypothetical protein